MRTRSLLVTAILLLLGVSSSLQAQRSVPGQVVDVIDAKTVVMQASSGKINVELQFIDVPAAGQPMFETVKEHLRALTVGKVVDFRIRNILADHSIGRLTANGMDISQQMIRDGAAWHVPANLSGQEPQEFEAYASTEAAARNEKRGVWSVPGLKPSWEQPAATKVVERSSRPASTNAPAGIRPKGQYGDTNPRLGNIGALVNGYNASKREGFLSTSLLGVDMKDSPFDGKFALDITYFYKENEGKGRKGYFVFTLACDSRELHFLKDNTVYAVFGEKKLNLGRPGYQATDGPFGTKREMMRYRISRETLEKIVNNDDSYLKVGQHLIYITAGRYLIFNMLQLTAE